MPSTPHISSLTNERVKALVRLRTHRERVETGHFIIEEPLVIARAREAGWPFAEIWACRELMDKKTAALYASIADEGVPAVEVTAMVMNKVAYRDRSDGLLVIAPRRECTLGDLILPEDPAPLIVVVDTVEKPGNLGAILRIADGAGAHAVLVCGGTDLDNPNGLRASRGAYFMVPTVAAPQDEIIGWLRRRGIRLLAASPRGSDLWADCDLRGPTAIVLGAEHDGLSASMLKLCDGAVAIPMHGRGDSLNVATAAAILLYEATRQRRSGRETRER